MAKSTLLLRLFFLLLPVFSMATVDFNNFLDRLPKEEDIKERVKTSFNALFIPGNDGKLRPLVCAVCDECIVKTPHDLQISAKFMEAAKPLLEWDYVKDDRRKKEIEEHYSFDVQSTPFRKKRELSFTKGMALSPRGSFYKRPGKGKRWGFSCCQRCQSNLGKGSGQTLPRHAIINKNYAGVPPKVLLDLNECELAFLSPVKNYGYCFTHTGGTRRQMKGTCTFMRVQKQGIAESVCALEDLGLAKHVIVLFTGKMTKRQKERATERSKIRTDKLTPAMHWLAQNNSRWKDIDVAKVLQGLKQHQPVVLDKSEEVQSENENIEKEELFSVFYPDGATTPRTGGFEQPGVFKKFVTDLAKEGFDVEMESKLEKKFTRESDAETLMDACLLQCPYGIGGLAESRIMHDCSHSKRSDVMEYFEHTSRKSQSVFQEPIFQLIMYSMTSKVRIFRQSRLSLRGSAAAENLAENFDPKDVIDLIHNKRSNNPHGGTNTAKKYLSAIDACSTSLPHTNDASKKARGKGEAMQHHFGMASVFLTVTFDDENSLLTQAHSGIEVDDGTPVDTMTDEELSDRAKKRRTLRLDLPGLAAINFEMLFNILLKDVVGWDVDSNKATIDPGLFGMLEAFSYAIEEQGRGTLHAHMTLWVKDYKKIQHEVFFGAVHNKSHAKNVLGQYHQKVATTEFFPTDYHEQLKAFDHQCNEIKCRRRVPDVVSDQELRNLRNRKGYKDTEGIFASCHHCDKRWTYEEMIHDYLLNNKGIKDPRTTIPIFDVGLSAATPSKKPKKVVPKARMFAKIIEFQKDMSDNPDTPIYCIDATYQHHSSCHVNSCFKCQKKGNKQKGHKCGPNCECRYRLPDIPRRKAEVVHDASEEGNPWCAWNGTSKLQPLCQVLPRRNRFDLFQNVCCRGVSHSKFSCNSNVSLILDGPIGQCMHKHQEKENQQEETADYKTVETTIRKMEGERVHEDDRKEALRLICRGAFANNRSNVISPCFASYFLRHESRFYYSHEFKFCPLADVVRLHNKQGISGDLRFTEEGDACFFENLALDYLCRPDELDDICLKELTEEFQSAHVPKRKTDAPKKKKAKKPEVFPFVSDTGHYQHPSTIKKGANAGTCARGLKESEERVHARISQWMFPDTQQFGCDIRTASASNLNSKTELYAQLVLSLLMPHRCRGDITVANAQWPHAQKLQEVWQREQWLLTNHRADEVKVFTEENMLFLQNIQNCRANSLRHKVQNDPLSRKTNACESPDMDDSGINNEEEEEEIEPTPFDLFADELEKQLGSDPLTDEDPDFLPEKLQDFNMDNIRDKGTNFCGWNSDLKPPARVVYADKPFVKRTNRGEHEGTRTKPDYETEKKKYNVEQIVKLHLRRNQRKVKKVLWTDKDGEHDIKARDATGTVKSVREWAKAVFHADGKQRRAFECIISSFLLSFYEEDPQSAMDPLMQGTNRTRYRVMKRGLLKLRGIKSEANMMLLLHGPGGSGKSTVLNCALAYAKDYCNQLGHKFTNRTIVVSAMSGVAATLINGETTHHVVGLNRGDPKDNEIEAWADTRLLIIDEISFAAESDFELLYDKLQKMKQERYKDFGGIDVVFAGDYAQLEPVNKNTIYKDGKHSPVYHGKLNAFIELNGKWRFQKDPEWGEMMKRMREGNPTEEDIEIINSRHVDELDLPRDTQIATWTNKDRCAINTMLFEEYCLAHGKKDGSVLQGACVIFADNLASKDTSKNYKAIHNNTFIKHFYENVTEADLDRRSQKTSGRLDPCLKLYQDCPVMFTCNEDVTNGQANGSRVRVKEVVLKGGEKGFKLTLANGIKVTGLFASQVKSIEVEHENEDIVPRRFHVKSNKWQFNADIHDDIGDKVKLAMEALAFPLISNNCTTGHKLQGCTVDSILVNDWCYGNNWPYVVLSRVRTLDGFYLRRKLSTDVTKYGKPIHMKNMIESFARHKTVARLTDDEYAQLEEVCNQPVQHVQQSSSAQGVAF